MNYCLRKITARNKNGFSLAEVVLATGILVLVIVGLLRLYIYCAKLSAMSTNIAIALSATQDKLEEIRSGSYANIVANYSSGGTPGNTFDLTSPIGKGVIYIDSSNAELLQIDVVVCWQDRDGRVVGEDTNLNGALDTGEDINGNSKIDSPARLISNLARR